MFCRKCGEEVKEIYNFCGKCGEKQLQKSVTEKKEVKTLSLDSYKQFKREERAGDFKSSKSSTSNSTITRKSEPLMHSVTINVGILKNVNFPPGMRRRSDVSFWSHLGWDITDHIETS